MLICKLTFFSPIVSKYKYNVMPFIKAVKFVYMHFYSWTLTDCKVKKLYLQIRSSTAYQGLALMIWGLSSMNSWLQFSAALIRASSSLQPQEPLKTGWYPSAFCATTSSKIKGFPHFPCAPPIVFFYIKHGNFVGTDTAQFIKCIVALRSSMNYKLVALNGTVISLAVVKNSARPCQLCHGDCRQLLASDPWEWKTMSTVRVVLFLFALV